MKKICRGHRAWTTKTPDAYDILKIMRDTKEKSTVVTCIAMVQLKSTLWRRMSRLMTARRRRSARSRLTTWPTLITTTTRGSSGMKTKLLLALLALYKGLRLYLTKNMNKKDHFVNGMQVNVVDYDERSHCLKVMTKTRKRLHLITEDVEGHGRVTYFPVRLGSACTVQKVQGTTLDHISIWLDVSGCRADAYVALSRVQCDTDYLIGAVVCPRQFIPAM